MGSEYEKSRAYGDVFWVDGITEANNELKVKWIDREGVRAKTFYPTDDELAKAVTDELMQDSRLNTLDLVVTASYGHVTLKGSIANYHQKNIAEIDTHDVVGVVWVTNDLIALSMTREDFMIREDILSDIATYDTLWNQDIHVKVNNGIVTLSGKVDTGYDRLNAGDVASRIRGVRKVNNELEINLKQEQKDASLLVKVVERIKTNWLLSPVKDKIKVAVKKGVVTLTGTVFNWGERREAERVAFNTNGIRMVDNRLQVEGYNYPWSDWYLTDPDNMSWFYYGYDYPYGYYWDYSYFPSRQP